jgi:hypothetical protein
MAGCAQWTAGGYSDVIKKRLADPKFFSAYGLVNGVKRILTEQIEADTTDELGFPISIFELNGPNGHWEENGACQDQGQNSPDAVKLK